MAHSNPTQGKMMHSKDMLYEQNMSMLHTPHSSSCRGLLDWPLAHLFGLWPISWAFGPITIQSMDDLDRLQGRYPEKFVLISQLEVCQERGSRRGVLGGRSGFLTRDMEDRVTPDIMNYVFLPQGRYPEYFVLISHLEEGQERGGQEGRYLEEVECC